MRAASILLVACALFVFAMVRVIAFGTEATEQDREPLNTVATPDFAPATSPRYCRRTSRCAGETRNLGNGTLGRSYTYGDGARAVELHVGFEALDIYEDLDFAEHEVVVGGIPRTVHVPRAINSGFLGVAWDDPQESSLARRSRPRPPARRADDARDRRRRRPRRLAALFRSRLALGLESYFVLDTSRGARGIVR